MPDLSDQAETAIVETKHKVYPVRDHTGMGDGRPCFKWGDRIGLFLNTYGTASRPGLRHVSRSTVGDRRGDGWRWVPITCHTPGCKFEALVRVDWLEDVVADALDNGRTEVHDG